MSCADEIFGRDRAWCWPLPDRPALL